MLGILGYKARKEQAGAGSMVHGVERLPSKLKVLSLTPLVLKNKTKRTSGFAL
jgi:hypothetical protein